MGSGPSSSGPYAGWTGDMYVKASGFAVIVLYPNGQGSGYFYEGTPYGWSYDSSNFGSYYNGIFVGPDGAIGKTKFVDSSGHVLATGGSTSGIYSFWVNGTNYYFQGTQGTYGPDVYASDGNGQLIFTREGYNNGGTISGDDGISGDAPFSGSMPAPSGGGSITNVLFYLNLVSGASVPAYSGAPSSVHTAPSGEPPAVYVTMGGTPVLWWFLSYDETENVYYYVSPDYRQTGHTGGWLALSGSGPSATATLAGVPTTGDIATNIQYTNGVFQGAPVAIRTANADGSAVCLAGTPTNEPAALWVNGDKWYLSAMDTTGAPNTFTYLGPQVGQSVVITDPQDGFIGNRRFAWTDLSNSAVGTYWMPDVAANSYFIADYGSHIWLDIRPATLGGQSLPASTPFYGPPSIVLNGTTWSFQKNLVDSQSSRDVYVHPGDRTLVLWLAADGTLVQPPDLSTVLGKYNHGLFQNIASGNALAAGGVTIPAAASGHPNTLTINGQQWTRSTASNGSQDVYLGPQFGQQLSIDGSGSVSYSNSAIGINTPINGNFSGGDFRFGSRLPANQTMLADGTNALIPQTMIDGSLDVSGNTLSLGQWLNDPQTSGFTLQFSDLASSDSPPLRSSSIGFIQTRSQASWLWQHGAGDQNNVVSMMSLDPNNKLGLFDPADTSSTPSPALLLDPGSMGTSSFPGSFIANGQISQLPNQTLNNGDPTVILTRGLGDSLYAHGVGLVTSSPQDTAFGRYNTGTGTVGTSGTADPPLFELGNGTSDAARSNALTVTNGGDTILQSSGYGGTSSGQANLQALQVNGNASFNGTMAVTGSTSVTDISIAGGATVHGGVAIGGNTALGGGLTIAGTTVLNGGVTVGGTTTVQGLLIIANPAGGIDPGEFNN